jgi:hypothetical protein
MFAPRVTAKPAKAAVRVPTNRLVEGAQRKSNTHDEQEGQPARVGGSVAVARTSFDFSKVPIFSRDQPAPFQLAQPRLAVGPVDDPLELEADRVADQVMCPERGPFDSVYAGVGEGPQKQPAGLQSAVSDAPAVVHEVLRSPGKPLDTATRAYFEPRFGLDFSGVRVHVDAAAAQSARDVNAHAYTVGHDIAFDSGRFAPGSRAGRQLLAHELTHVVQQRQGKPLVQRAPPRDPNPKWVSPSSGEIQPAKPVYNIAVNPNNLDWRGQNHTLQEALDKAFEQVCYDDNGISTGITMDQLHESAWVKTSYGKTVPVEWKGPHGAEVSIDVAHNAPAPDIAHVGWQRPGKSESGHIFLDDTPYGRAPLTVPQAKFPTPRRTPPAGGGVDTDQVAGVEGKVAGTEATKSPAAPSRAEFKTEVKPDPLKATRLETKTVKAEPTPIKTVGQEVGRPASHPISAEAARAIANMEAAAAEGVRFTARVHAYVRIFSAIQKSLSYIDAASVALTVSATGTALPEPMKQAQRLLAQSVDDRDHARLFSRPSLDTIFQLYAAENATTLSKIASTCGNFSTQERSIVAEFRRLSVDIRKNALEYRSEAVKQLASSVTTVGREETASSYVELIIGDALKSISNLLENAADNYAEAARLAEVTADDANLIANLCNDMLLAGFHVLTPRCHFLHQDCEQEQKQIELAREAGRAIVGPGLEQ